MIDSTRPDSRRQTPEKPPRGSGRRGKYLPSAQVIEELTRLGPDLSSLAEELRIRLSESADDPRR